MDAIRLDLSIHTIDRLLQSHFETLGVHHWKQRRIAAVYPSLHATSQPERDTAEHYYAGNRNKFIGCFGTGG